MTAERRRARPAELTLRSGLAITPEEASELARDRRVAMLALVGPAASGKTTLIAGCFQYFSSAVPPTLWFRGSKTLVAFEELCHPWRLASGRSEPASIHTELDNNGLLHLELIRQPDKARVDLLLADVSGEWFDRVRHGVDGLGSFPFLQRADHVAFCLDGERISGPAERHVAIGEIRDLIRAWAQSGWLRKGISPTLVLTKWDSVSNDPGLASTSDVALVALTQFAGRHGVNLAVARTAFRTSADGTVEPGFGVAELLDRWAAELPPWGDQDRTSEPVAAARAIDRLREVTNDDS